jgi:hypothetical protein
MSVGAQRPDRAWRRRSSYRRDRTDAWIDIVTRNVWHFTPTGVVVENPFGNSLV